MVDAELIEDAEYAGFGDTPVARVKTLLGRLNSAWVSRDRGSEVKADATDLFYKFTEQVEQIFAALPKLVEWLSFYLNDLPLATDLDPEVQKFAPHQERQEPRRTRVGRAQDAGRQRGADATGLEFNAVDRAARLKRFAPDLYQ